MGVNEQIIEMLRKNSRTSFSEIGRTLDLSEGAIRKRVSNLLEGGTIKKFTVETNFNHSAIVGIKTNPQISTQLIIKKLKEGNIGRVFETTGRFDLFCIISTDDAEQINLMLEKIRTTAGVIGTETFSILKEN